MHRWDEVTEGYVACCQARGMSAERVKATRREMERWGNWLKARRPRPSVEEIDAELIVRYVRERTVCRAKATVADVVSKLRGVGEYLVREKYWAQNPLRWLRGPKIDPYAQVPLRLGREAMKQLWQKAAAVPAELGRLKALAALALLYGTGLRRGELVRLNVSDWDATAGTLRVDGRKTGRQRCVLLPELAARCLEAYLPARQQHLEELGADTETALLVNQHGGRLKGAALSAALFRLARRAEVPLARLHQFRHTCASDLLEAGVVLPQVQRVLGHAAVTSTVRYLQVSDPQRRAAVERHPLVEWLKAGAA